MDAYVITLRGDRYSERVAQRCVDTGMDVGGVDVKIHPAVPAKDARRLMETYGIAWTWGKGGGGMNHHSYGGSDDARIGCALSHLELWMAANFYQKPILILEHDAVFVKKFEPISFKSACMINDPRGATPRGEYWHSVMQKQGPGVWPKTRIFDDSRPDGLAGGSAYVINPKAAKRLLELVSEHGLWPNDAMLCRQFIPDLEQHYPYITEVRAEKSTIDVR